MTSGVITIMTDVSKRSNQFSDLLDKIENADERVKSLWREIYDNAIRDRDAAAALFDALSLQCKNSASQDAAHAMHGPTLVKYLERMHKSNEQLLKLSELIAESAASAAVDPDQIMDRIRQG